MEGDQKITWSETVPYFPPTIVFPWGLAGPITDFDCGFTDMEESHAYGDTASNNADPVSTKRLIVNAMARQSINPSLVDSTVGEGVAGHIAPEHDAGPFDDDGRTAVSSLQAGSTPGGKVCVSSLGFAASAPDIFESPRTDLGERHRGPDDDLGDDGHGLRLREKGKTKVATAVRVLEVAGYTDRTDRKPAVKAPTSVNTTSKAVGYKAGVLMTPNAHGGSDQLLHVPSVQQESTVMIMQEELPSVEGSRQGVMRGQSDRIVQEEAEIFSMENVTLEETKHNVFYIPKRLKEDYRQFLEATSEDFERGTLHVVKCKLCPGVTFKTWDHFTRHCKTAELHPLRLLFCDHCGDFFARGDSLERHSSNRPSECHDISQQEAETKRSETRAIHREFLNNTKAYLEANQGTWTPFAQVIKEKYPGSSKRLKRGIGQQSRLRAAVSISS